MRTRKDDGPYPPTIRSASGWLPAPLRKGCPTTTTTPLKAAFRRLISTITNHREATAVGTVAAGTTPQQQKELMWEEEGKKADIIIITIQQMNTPDDPVIHSPPSLRSPNSAAAAAAQRSAAGLNGNAATGNMFSSSQGSATALMPTGALHPGLGRDNGTNDSPLQGSAGDMGDVESRRRQKTCRVCGDHATGYNFNVITCESCKAFFRRNALRPKEFKCPYSDDCEINAVSRRFCQKCRLRKCFNVGMKKEWILNEEQLRRRKNSRLNNLTGQPGKHPQIKTEAMTPDVMKPPGYNVPLSTPMSIIPPGNPMMMQQHQRRSIDMPMISPPGATHNPMMSPTGSNVTVSPSMNSSSPDSPSRMMGGGLPQLDNDAYDSESARMMRQQQMMRSSEAAFGKSLSPNFETLMHKGQQKVALSMQDFQQLMAAATSGEPAAKRAAYGMGFPVDQTNILKTLGNSHGQIRSTLGGMDYTDLSSCVPSSQAMMQMQNMQRNLPPEMLKRQKHFEDTIHDALINSPDAQPAEGALQDVMFGADGGDPHLNFQLNTAELRALDVVRDAFKCMNDNVEDRMRANMLLKSDHNPADIMNIMDITMRRLVKMAKKLPAFNDLSQEGKFALLKGAMVEMLTLRGVSRFNEAEKCWQTPVVSGQSASVSVDMFSKLNSAVRDQSKSDFLTFCHSLHPEVRKNELAIDLIVLIVLFCPNRPAINNPDDKITIQKHFKEYSSLLNRYLESIHGPRARELYESLPKSLDLLRTHTANSATLFVNTVNPDETEALPKEFFKTTAEATTSSSSNSSEPPPPPSTNGDTTPHHSAPVTPTLTSPPSTSA
ncbi:hypothetical protein QR680_016169 [Steinernema hermaphroditum]|uniref:Nuclear receptor domain-containing protein n=1 Tax=Steinernema hermaphroditum TaxID=289476 RepID=A0AA39HCG4_9BILA|nr:hypothetical protein QR680_016169 [Steinernema hermaphroditum]